MLFAQLCYINHVIHVINITIFETAFVYIKVKVKFTLEQATKSPEGE